MAPRTCMSKSYALEPVTGTYLGKGSLQVCVQLVHLRWSSLLRCTLDFSGVSQREREAIRKASGDRRLGRAAL